MDAKIKLDHHLLALEGEHAVHCMLELDVPLADGPVRAALRIRNERGKIVWWWPRLTLLASKP